MIAKVSFAILAFSGILQAPLAFAAGNARSNLPEAFYQPNVNNKVAEVGYATTMSSDTYTQSQGGVRVSDVKQSDNVYSLLLGYGLTEQIAFRVSAGLASTTKDVTAVAGGTSNLKASGMTDVAAALVAIVPFSGWSLHFGIEGATSPSTHKLPTASAEGNEVSGGSVITPYVGLSWALAGGDFTGIKALWVSRGERSENANTSGAQDYKLSGGSGSTYELFYQMTWSDFDLDLRAGLISQAEVTYTYADGSRANREGISSPFMNLGAQYQITSSTNFRAAYMLTMIPSYTDISTQIGSYNHGVASLRLRVEF